MNKVFLLIVTLLALSSVALAQSEMAHARTDVFGSSSCMGCHGTSAMGGLGPPLAQTKLTEEEFVKTVRKGKGMMPPTPEAMLSDQDLRTAYAEVKSKPWDDTQIPLAYRVGSMLSTKVVARIFMVAGILSLLLSLWVLRYWVKLANLGKLRPALKRFGVGKAAFVFIRSLFVDGLFVASLWRTNRFRWAMHGLILYGFLGLGLADILMQINDPTRAKLPMDHPIKVFAVICGASVISGVFYVMFRYKTDKYVDNGVTLGRDFLFVNLLLHSIFSGFLTLTLSRTGAFTWVMPVYIYHLLTVLTLIVSMPFTRMNHIFVVPVMAGLTAVTDAIVKSGVEIAFDREPSPGRHHKSVAIAESVLKQVDPESAGEFRLRYYP
ncbi:MAG: cytochrome c [Armatimonadetes bacterium]|nr:cytochrome c [Armatimonadota bacterium]